jgi:hypothetical protein
LRKANQGPFEQIADSGHIPLLDIGTTRAIRRGSIRVVPGIESFVGDRIRFATGEERRFDAVVLATGYRPATPPGVAGGLRGAGQVKGSDPGLYYCGFFVSPTGMLREISREARSIGREIARELGTLAKA